MEVFFVFCLPSCRVFMYFVDLIHCGGLADKGFEVLSGQAQACVPVQKF